MIVDTAELLLTKLDIYPHETLDMSSRGRLKAWGDELFVEQRLLQCCDIPNQD